MHMRRTLVAVACVTWSFVSSAAAEDPARLIEIDRLGADEAYISDLNNWGQVVGSLATNTEGQPSYVQPFLWFNGRTRVLEAPAQVSEARAINGLGRVVGSLYEADGKVRPVTWALGRLARLRSEPQAIAVDVNNRGQIVGYNSNSRGVLWQNASSEPTDLGTLGGGFCEPTAINDHGVIVGISAVESNELHAFVLEDGVFTDVGLPDHPDPAIEIVRTRLEAINEDGLAVGFAYASDGAIYPLVWTRERGGRVLATPVTSTIALNGWGTIAAVTPASELFVGSFGRPLRSRGSFSELTEIIRFRLNDLSLIALSGRRDGKQRGFVGALRP